MVVEARSREIPAREVHRTPLPEVISPYEVADIVLTQAVKDIMKATGDVMLVDKDKTGVSVEIGGWLHYKLRDRQTDGPLWEPSRLTQWPYAHPDDRFTTGHAVEESTYWLDPRYPLTDIFSPKEADFITNPFEHLPYDNPTPEALEEWVESWKRVTAHPETLYPGQYTRHHIPGLRQHILTESKKLLKAKGYTHLTAVPTWFHTAQLYDHLGFQYTYEDDEEKVKELQARLPHKTKEERAFASWVVMRQFWAELAEKQGVIPEDFVDDPFILRDNEEKLVTFPLTPQRNLWMQQAV